MNIDELIIDNFAGGGGASLGIAKALGRSPDIAINHDERAIGVHRQRLKVQPAKESAGPAGVASRKRA